LENEEEQNSKIEMENRNWKMEIVIPRADIMGLRPTNLHENGRSALECGSEAAALNSSETAVAHATALQGAFGTTIFMAARNLALVLPSAYPWALRGGSRPRPERDSSLRSE
jgi:hypothetical protein